MSLSRQRTPYKLWLDFNNYQSPSVGEARGIVTMEHQNLTGNGDVATADTEDRKASIRCWTSNIPARHRLRHNRRPPVPKRTRLQSSRRHLTHLN